MTIPSSRSLILWISVFLITSPSADFGRLRKTSDVFGNLRKWSCRLQKSQHSQDKNLTLISQKKLAGIHTFIHCLQVAISTSKGGSWGPGKVGHTTRVYKVYKVLVLWERPTVFRPYPSTDVITKAALSSQLFKGPECWSGRSLNKRPPAQQTGAMPTELTRRRFRWKSLCVKLWKLKEGQTNASVEGAAYCLKKNLRGKTLIKQDRFTQNQMKNKRLWYQVKKHVFYVSSLALSMW